MVLSESVRENCTLPPPGNTSKQVAAMMALAGLADAAQINRDILKKDGVQNMFTFYGYYLSFYDEGDVAPNARFNYVHMLPTR